MKPFYRPIIKDAWTITRKNVFLWPLALFASVLGTIGTFQVLFDLLSNNAVSVFASTDFITSSFVGWNEAFGLLSISTFTISDIPAFLGLLAIFIVIFGVAVLVISSEGALIYGIKQVLVGKRASFLVSFRAGYDRFWELFFIYMVFKLLSLIIAALLITPLIYLVLSAAPLSRLLISIGVYMIIIPFVIILDLVRRYALMYIMLDEYQTPRLRTFVARMFDAVKKAWLLFKTNWIISLETSVLLLVTTAIWFTLVVLLLIPVITILFIFFGAVVSFSPTAFDLFSLTALITISLVFIMCLSMYTTFQMALWTGVFTHIAEKSHLSKIHRSLAHLPFLHKKIL